MALRKTSHSSKFVGDYQAPELFPEEDRFKRYQEKRAYVERELSRLAENHALFLTDVANQPRGMVSLANEVFNGIKIADGGDTEVKADVPPSLRSMRVKLQSMDGKPLAWKGGREAARAYGGDNIRQKQNLFEDFFYESDNAEETLDVEMAWKALRFCGEHCRHAPSGLSRKINWRIREVKPDGYDAYFSGDGLSASTEPQQGLRKRRVG